MSDIKKQKAAMFKALERYFGTPETKDLRGWLADLFEDLGPMIAEELAAFPAFLRKNHPTSRWPSTAQMIKYLAAMRAEMAKKQPNVERVAAQPKTVRAERDTRIWIKRGSREWLAWEAWFKAHQDFMVARIFYQNFKRAKGDKVALPGQMPPVDMGVSR